MFVENLSHPSGRDLCFRMREVPDPRIVKSLAMEWRSSPYIVSKSLPPVARSWSATSFCVERKPPYTLPQHVYAARPASLWCGSGSGYSHNPMPQHAYAARPAPLWWCGNGSGCVGTATTRCHDMRTRRGRRISLAWQRSGCVGAAIRAPTTRVRGEAGVAGGRDSPWCGSVSGCASILRGCPL